MADPAAAASRRPADTPFKQQRLKAWQPILSPKWVVSFFILFGFMFIILGSILFQAAADVIEVSTRYDNRLSPPGNGSTGTFTITVPKDMPAPVYMYYNLNNFYQNHRRYVSSRSDSQLMGNKVLSASLSDCKPMRWNGDMKGQDFSGNYADIVNPCGLIAWSKFNDTFVLKNSANTVLCDGLNPSSSTCKKEGIAWQSDVDKKFALPAADARTNFMYGGTNVSYPNEPGHLIPNAVDEDLIVWMRTAALPNFRKLYRIIQTTVPAGTYTVQFTDNFPVSTFSGEKYIVLSTMSWIGGKNPFLGIAYLIVGSILLATGASLFLKNMRSPRSLGDLKDINFDR